MFNCEHFAIVCESGGKTRYSRYGPIQGEFATLTRSPMLSAVAELNTRLVEWLAFNLGGPSGKHLSLVNKTHRFLCDRLALELEREIRKMMLGQI